MAARFTEVAALVLVLALLWAGPARAGSGALLLTEEMKPFNYLEDGFVRGLSADTIGEALRDAGIGYRMELLPWARAYARTLAEPGAFLFSLARTPEREQLFAWVAPLAPAQVCLFRLAARQDLAWVDRAVLPGYRVAAVRGYFTVEVLRQWGVPEANLALFPDSGKRAAIGHLELGRSDFFLGDPLTFGMELREAGKQGLVVRHGEPVRVSDYYLAANPRTDPELVRRVAEALERIQASGRAQAIRQEYMQRFALP